MFVQIILGILVIFYAHQGEADVRELQLGGRVNNEYLPPQETLTGYKYSQPHVLDDPLPEKVNFIAPLKLDFPRDEIIFKPIYKGALISGLFLKDNERPLEASTNNIMTVTQKELFKPYPTYKNYKLPLTSTTTIPKLSYQFENSEMTPTTYTIQSNLNTRVDYGKLPNNNAKKIENSFKPNKHQDVVPINYREETTTEYKLFNYDDETVLNSTPPEVIYKSGDDISFIDDTTVIDDYVYVHVPLKKKKNKLDSTSEKSISDITTSPVPMGDLRSSTESTSKEDEDTLNNPKTSGHGYVYEKPKIPFNF